MRRSVRNAVLAGAAMLSVGLVASPVTAAEGGGVAGVWESTDTDGSAQRLVVADGPGNTHHVLYVDEGASVCGTGPRGDLVAATLRGTMTLAGNELGGDLPLVCRTGPPALLGVFWLTFTYVPETDTIVDTFGIVWSRS